MERPHKLVRLCLPLLVVAMGCASAAPDPEGGRWRKDDYHLSYGPPYLDRTALRNPPEALEDISARIWLVSDNQRHELLGKNIQGIRMARGDESFAESAVRPPQLDLFGQDLLREALDRTDGFALHLGDACDISNTAEFALFCWDMRRAKGGWLMTPGNHDGYFMGNTSRDDPYWQDLWHKTGERYVVDGVEIVSRAMQKNDFIGWYLAAIILQRSPWSEPLARRLGPECVAVLEKWSAVKEPTFAQYWQHLKELQASVYRAAADGKTHQIDLSDTQKAGAGVSLRRLVWSIDLEKRWRSYLVQEIDISAGEKSPISVLVLDTSHYHYQPSFENAALSYLPSKTGIWTQQLAGTHGTILKPQVASVEWIMEKMRAEERRWILAHHHPYGDLTRYAWDRLDPIRDAGGIPLTLSGHSHNGKYIWHHDEKREGRWLELNVGSLLDAPVAYRDFQVKRVGKRLAVHTRRFKMENILRKEGLLAENTPRYRPSPGDADYYMEYRIGWDLDSFSSEATEVSIRRILIIAYLRMFRLFPNDEQNAKETVWPTTADGTQLDSHEKVIAELERYAAISREDLEFDDVTRLLYRLREYDGTRPVKDREGLRAYRLSQAIWAGQAELPKRGLDTHEIDPDLSFILLPPGAKPASR